MKQWFRQQLAGKDAESYNTMKTEHNLAIQWDRIKGEHHTEMWNHRLLSSALLSLSKSTGTTFGPRAPKAQMVLSCVNTPLPPEFPALRFAEEGQEKSDPRRGFLSLSMPAKELDQRLKKSHTSHFLNGSTYCLLHCIHESLSLPQLPFSVPSIFSFS